MSTFRPERVSPRSSGLWLSEAFALWKRQPLSFLAIALLWAGIWYLPLPFSYLLLLGLPLPLAAGCLVAHAADTSQPSIAVIRTVSLRAWRDILVTGAAPWIVVAAVTWTIAVLSAPINVLAGTEFTPPIALPFTDSGDWQAFRDLFAVTFLWMSAVGIVGWFQLPLMIIAGLGPVQAYQQTVRGLALNGFVVGLVFVLAWVCIPLLSLLSPLFAAPLLSLLSSMMYVSFRHIWLGRGRNEPVKTATPSSDDWHAAPSQAFAGIKD